MIHLTRLVVQRWLDKLLHIHDSPRRTAAAYALGVFLGFSPYLGLHHVLALICAFALNLNRVAVFAGVWTNLPWIVAPWYAVTTAAGAAVLGTTAPPELAGQLRDLFERSVLQVEFWRRLAVVLRPLFWPYIVGSTVGAAVLSSLAYPLALGFLTARHRRRGTGAL